MPKLAVSSGFEFSRILFFLALFLIICNPSSILVAADLTSLYRENGKYTRLSMIYPEDGVLFPPEIVPPTFRWKDEKTDSDSWLIWIKFQDKKVDFTSLNNTKPGTSEYAYQTQWTPSFADWEMIKKRSLEKKALLTILGYDRKEPEKILSHAVFSISTSKDRVDAPIFYREVNLPFREAVKDPARYIRWRFGTIDLKESPPIVLEKIPTCANCH
ncbi:hypothetical protein ACFL35_20145, partial [Candidatus Riflebacteria bacterium]